MQSSLANKTQIKTINDFLKRQDKDVRTQLLKNMDQNILNFLDSDLYTEAVRLRTNNRN